MKLKFKLLPGQYAELVNAIGILSIKAAQNKTVTNLDLINVKYFYFDGLQKVNRLQLENKSQSTKQKIFSIDINHYQACRNVLTAPGINKGIYLQAVFLSIEQKAEPAILSEAERLKTVRE